MPAPYTCLSECGPGPSYAADPARGDFGCDFVGGGEEGSTFPDGDNGIGGAGVAPDARVLPVRACYGGNPDCFGEPALDGQTYAVTMGATAINAS